MVMRDAMLHGSWKYRQLYLCLFVTLWIIVIVLVNIIISVEKYLQT